MFHHQKKVKKVFGWQPAISNLPNVGNIVMTTIQLPYLFEVRHPMPR